jgi:hypothetical protein
VAPAVNGRSESSLWKGQMIELYNAFLHSRAERLHVPSEVTFAKWQS